MGPALNTMEDTERTPEEDPTNKSIFSYHSAWPEKGGPKVFCTLRERNRHRKIQQLRKKKTARRIEAKFGEIERLNSRAFGKRKKGREPNAFSVTREQRKNATEPRKQKRNGTNTLRRRALRAVLEQADKEKSNGGPFHETRKGSRNQEREEMGGDGKRKWDARPVNSPNGEEEKGKGIFGKCKGGGKSEFKNRKLGESPKARETKKGGKDLKSSIGCTDFTSGTVSKKQKKKKKNQKRNGGANQKTIYERRQQRLKGRERETLKVECY